MLESEIDLLTKQILSENSIKLKYFETTETFGGEKFINSSDEVPKIVEKLSKLSSDIAIITDNPAKYTAINNVKVVGLDSVQGDEFEFAIIDKSWKDTSGKHYLTLKDLYTLTQRSTKGTIIVDNGVSLDLKLNTINDMTSAGSIEVSPDLWKSRSPSCKPHTPRLYRRRPLYPACSKPPPRPRRHLWSNFQSAY